MATLLATHTLTDCMYVCMCVNLLMAINFYFLFFPNQRWMLFVASSSSSGCAFALFYMASTEQIETRFTSWRSCCCRAHSHSRTYTLKKNLCNHSSTLILRVFRLAFHSTSLSMYIRQNCKPKQTARRHHRHPRPHWQTLEQTTLAVGRSSSSSWAEVDAESVARQQRQQLPKRTDRRARPLLLSTSATTTIWFCPRLVLVSASSDPGRESVAVLTYLIFCIVLHSTVCRLCVFW